MSWTGAERGGEPRRRGGGTTAVEDEVERALRALDSIAAETRSLSTSLGRTTAMTTTTTSSALSKSLSRTTAVTSTSASAPLRVQSSQTSTAVVVGSPRDTSAAAALLEQKRRQQVADFVS